MISKKLSRSKTKDLILNSDITQEISKKMRVENLEILLKTERWKKEEGENSNRGSIERKKEKRREKDRNSLTHLWRRDVLMNRSRKQGTKKKKDNSNRSSWAYVPSIE